MEKIVEDPQNRFDWWILKTFNVLPTSKEFQDLTGPQKDFIWHNYLEDNPKMKEKIKNINYDDDFNAEWDKLEPTDVDSEAAESLEGNDTSEDERLAEMAKRAYEELQSNEETRMTPAAERLQRNQLRSGDVDDWQEEDED